jgi:hypothetical protein
MKTTRIALILLLFLSCYPSNAQKGREHKGFYCSFGVGPARGNVNGYDNTGNVALISGTSTELNFQIGASFFRRWIVHAILDKKFLSGPTINKSKVSNNFSLNESILGGGLTHYTRGNFFLTGNIGTGNFSFSDQRQKVSTKNGLAILVKAGKEWWIAPDLAIGVALTYNQTRLNNPTSIGTSEKWNSNRIGILLQATFN